MKNINDYPIQVNIYPIIRNLIYNGDFNTIFHNMNELYDWLKENIGDDNYMLCESLTNNRQIMDNIYSVVRFKYSDDAIKFKLTW